MRRIAIVGGGDGGISGALGGAAAERVRGEIRVGPRDLSLDATG